MANANETSPAKPSAHTKGQWRVWDQHNELNFDTNTGRPLITAWDEKAEETIDVAEISQDNGEWIANARLIAAAPELLEHLEWLVREAQSVSAHWESGDLAHAVRALEVATIASELAIAKARGQAT